MSLLLGLLTSVLANASTTESVQLSRYFAVKTCDAAGECIGPVAKQIESANIEISLEPFRKGTASGLDGWDRNTIVEEKIPLKSEIHLIRHARPGKYKYYIYAMLRSGRRNGKIKKIDLKELSDLNEITLTDDPVPVAGGTLQAQLVLGPPLNLEVKGDPPSN